MLLSGKSSTFTGFVIPRLSQLTLKVLSLSSQLHFGGQVKERLTPDPSKNSVTKMRCLKTAFIMARRQCQKFLSIRWTKNSRPSHTHQWKLSNHFCYNIADKIRRDSQRLKLVNIFKIDFCERTYCRTISEETHLHINQMSMRKNVALRGRSGENWTSRVHHSSVSSAKEIYDTENYTKNYTDFLFTINYSFLFFKKKCFDLNIWLPQWVKNGRYLS